MQLGTPITSLWSSNRLLLLSISHSYTSSFILNFSSLSQPKVAHPLDGDSDDDEFLPWLESKTGVEISSVLSIGKSAYGRSLFASKNIRDGDCILKVPFDVQLSPDNLPSEIRTNLSSEVGNVAKLALFILLEQKKGPDSEWVPYTSRLPQPHQMHSTMFWSADELEMIYKSSVYQETIHHKSQIEKEFLAIWPHMTELLSEKFGRIALEDFMHAYALVSSRAWGSSKGFSLIPFADFLNHDGASESVVLTDEDRHFSEVIADRNYAPGDEVLIRYGKFPNATLVMDFGFALPNNIHDQVQIWLEISEKDPLRNIKLELLQRSFTPTIRKLNGLNSSLNCFTIREVMSDTGKGKGIPQSLRAFARVMCCTSPQELNELTIEAVNKDGRLARRPLNNITREIEAHRILLSRTQQLIEEYNASIKSLEPINFPIVRERYAIRKQMARYLLLGELRVLKSASTWLENYCQTLRTEGLLPSS